MINLHLENKKSFCVPPIDEILKHFKFKNNYLIFLSTNDAQNLHNKKLMYKNFSSYENLICKLENELSYDQNAFVELLIGLNSEEVCGNSLSGFPTSLNILKKTSNYYDNTLELTKYDILKRDILESYNIEHIDWSLYE